MTDRVSQAPVSPLRRGFDSGPIPCEYEGKAMRILLSCLSVCLVVTGAGVAAAQDRSPFDYEPSQPKAKRTPRLSRLSVKRETAAQLIHVRAVHNARQRRARIELRNWKGVSLMRPNMKTIVPLEGWYLPGGWWNGPSTHLQMQW
ncbi:MAG: hypothetical protein ACE5KM_04795 [Planctomycetaceae bacterium]